MKTIKNQFKRAFTIVELVIVIAVVAALAAILIPTFVNVLNSANESNDTVLAKNLDTSLITVESKIDKTNITDGAGNKIYNVTSAITWVRNDGYDVSKLTPTADKADYVYNASTNHFLYYTDNFSTLAYGEEPASTDTLIVIDTDLDRVGLAETADFSVQYCVYTTYDAGADINNDSNITVWVYSESGSSVNINLANGTVYQYGESTTTNVDAVASSSWHLYGTVETLKAKKGHIVYEDDCNITGTIYYAASSEGDLTVTQSSNANVTEKAFATVAVTVKDENGTADTSATATITVVGTDVDFDKLDTVTYLTAAPSGELTTGNYVINAAIEGNFVIAEKAVVVIDLNGYTIKGVTGGTYNATFYNKGVLTLTGSGNVTCSGSGEDAAVYSAYGAYTYIDGGTYTQGNWYLLHNYGYMEINDATIIGTSTSSSVVHNGYADYSTQGNGNSEAIMVINGLYFNNDYSWSDDEDTSSLIKNDDNGNLTINGGTFKNAPAWVLLNWNECTINGGYFSGDYCIGAFADEYDYVSGELTINGGTFENTGSSTSDLITINGHVTLDNDGNTANGTVTVTINGGTFINTSSTSTGSYCIAIRYAELTINGGTFEAAKTVIYGGHGVKVTIMAGTFNGSQWLYASGSSAFTVSGGTFTQMSGTNSYVFKTDGNSGASITVTGVTV